MIQDAWLYENKAGDYSTKSLAGGEIVSHIYIADNGVIFAACDWFTMYQTDSENYDDFLLLLEEYAQECFVSYLWKDMNKQKAYDEIGTAAYICVYLYGVRK